MKKTLFLAFCTVFLSIFNVHAQLRAISSAPAKEEKKMPSIYDFKVKDIEGKDFYFSSLKGKKILIVNTASQCGYTPQYAELETLSQKFKDKLVVVGFPTNDFGGQEPGNNKQIAEFCKKNYGVTFPMMGKISVVDKQMDLIYTFLTQKSQNGFLDSTVKWNFQKYLFDENGQMVAMYESKVSPMSDEVLEAINKRTVVKETKQEAKGKVKTTTKPSAKKSTKKK